jgi:hypothetical protein
MLHLATSWPQRADSKWWPQAIDYATWVFNKLPNMESRISSDELWSGVSRNDSILQHAQVFGCPVYVIDAALQYGKKIPKWNPWARLGLFLRFSDLEITGNCIENKFDYDSHFGRHLHGTLSHAKM